ncbi:MAG: iron-sulfur cluster assembly accessory protein [Anaeromyxobacter sp.]
MTTPAATPSTSTAPSVAAEQHGIQLSEKAAVRIRAMIAERGTPAGGLRLGVQGGGCSGLEYVVAWADAPTEKDLVVERDGGRLVVDRRSAKFLEGTVVEWQSSLMQSGFVFKNPNVKGSCSCGESFSV